MQNCHNKIYSLKKCCFVVVLILAVSCKIQPSANRHYADNDPNKVYKLRLNPADGSTYYYTIDNESELKLEVNDKKVDNQSKTAVGASYAFHKDSMGDFRLAIVYDKIHLYTRNGDKEMDIDADKAAGSTDAGEKLLGIVKGATIEAVINPQGQMMSIKGYDTIKSRIMASFGSEDVYSRSVVEKQWDERIKEGLIKKNMEQLFKIFPDSAVHVGDRWKLDAVQKDEVSMNVRSSYQLKEIHDGVATIRSEGTISSDSTSGNSRGYAYTADLKGTQEGEFQMDMGTGLLISCTIVSDVEGQMEVMGKTIPVTIHSSVKMLGRKE